MILKTLNLVLLLLFSTFILESQQKSQQKSPPPPPSRLLIFSFDGMRADALSDPSVTPTLYSLAASGVTGVMKPTFTSKTFPNHHSIATGLYQPYHGVINNIFIDPETDEKFSVDNSSSFWWDMFNRNVPLYIANQVFEPERRFSGSLQWPGAISTYTSGEFLNTEDPKDSEKDHKKPKSPKTRHQVHYLQRFSRSLNWTSAIDDLLFDRWLLSTNAPANLVLLYFHEPDSTSHDHGPFSAEVREQLVRIDQTVAHFLGRFYKQKEDLINSTNLLFISDHGMAEIAPDRVIYLEQCTTILGPDLKYRLVGISPVFSIVPLSAPEDFLNSSSNLVSAVQSALNFCSKFLFQSKFTVYQQAEILPEYHYSGNRRILELFLLAEDGYEVKYSKADGKRIPRGNHGFNNSLPSMRPLFIGLGPSFKSGGYKYRTVFENVDLYPLALELLGIPSNLFPSNGSLDRVKGLLKKGVLINGNDFEEEEGAGAVLVVAFFETVLFGAFIVSLLISTRRL